jgi:2,4-dienoyl-CoA reductase-like NADH-dependent reductase (Old Yellow Enzyme family)
VRKSSGKLEPKIGGKWRVLANLFANPDLPERIKAGAPLNAANPSTFYKPGPAGYIDYPFLGAA